DGLQAALVAVERGDDVDRCKGVVGEPFGQFGAGMAMVALRVGYAREQGCRDQRGQQSGIAVHWGTPCGTPVARRLSVYGDGSTTPPCPDPPVHPADASYRQSLPAP